MGGAGPVGYGEQDAEEVVLREESSCLMDGWLYDHEILRRQRFTCTCYFLRMGFDFSDWYLYDEKHRSPLIISWISGTEACH